MGAKSITIVRAVTADFFFDCRAAEVPSDEWIRDVPWGVHNHAQRIYICYVEEGRPPLWSSAQSSWLQIQRAGFDSRRSVGRYSSLSDSGHEVSLFFSFFFAVHCWSLKREPASQNNMTNLGCSNQTKIGTQTPGLPAIQDKQLTKSSVYGSVFCSRVDYNGQGTYCIFRVVMFSQLWIIEIVLVWIMTSCCFVIVTGFWNEPAACQTALCHKSQNHTSSPIKPSGC
jgi:hypothetical protein